MSDKRRSIELAVMISACYRVVEVKIEIAFWCVVADGGSDFTEDLQPICMVWRGIREVVLRWKKRE